MSSQALRRYATTLLFSASISSLLLALHLFTMLTRFAKDLNEVTATWEYIASFITVGILGLVVCWKTIRS